MPMRQLRFRPLQDLSRIIFPALCCHCGEVLVGDERFLCTACLSHLPWARHAAIPNNETEQRIAGRIPATAAAALLIFHKGNVTQDIVHQIKYHGNTQMARQYGRMLGTELLQSGRFDNIDMIVPVPLHWWRKLQRGYNQSELICNAMAQVMHLPVMTGNLYRKRYTSSQTHKTRQDRLQNMKDVFAVRHPEQFEHTHILLVDDIITTGATTESCYHALQNIPKLQISIACLALTSF